MKKYLVLVLVLVIAGCGLSRREAKESAVIANGVFSQRISTPEFKAVVAQEANREAHVVMNTNFSPMWTQEYKTQPIVKQTIVATMAVPLAATAMVSYNMQTLEVPVFFILDSYVLSTVGRQQMQAKADILNANHKIVLTIVGRASGLGGTAHNTTLSKLRAEMCQQYLVAQNINPNRLLVTYRGESDAISQGLYEDQRADFSALVVYDGLGIELPPEGPGIPVQPIATLPCSPQPCISEATLPSTKPVKIPAAPKG